MKKFLLYKFKFDFKLSLRIVYLEISSCKKILVKKLFYVFNLKHFKAFETMTQGHRNILRPLNQLI